MLRRALAALSLGLGIVGLAAPAAAQGEQVARFELTGVIDQVNAAFLEEALRVAADEESAAVVMVIDSPGGELTSMDRIVKAILGSDVPVIAWVAPEGARRPPSSRWRPTWRPWRRTRRSARHRWSGATGATCPRRWPPR
jgi:membrane-bound ClpP family serine protease